MGYVKFENVDQWIARYDFDVDDGREFEASELMDENSAADYLGNLYRDYYWVRGPRESSLDEFEDFEELEEFEEDVD